MVTLLFSDNNLIGSFLFKHACDVCSAFYFTFIQLNLCKLTGQEIALYLTHTLFLEPDKILFRILVLLLWEFLLPGKISTYRFYAELPWWRYFFSPHDWLTYSDDVIKQTEGIF